MKTTPSIAIIGPGAIGGMLAACFCEAGYEPLVVCRTKVRAEQLTRDGISFESGDKKVIHFPKTSTDIAPEGISPEFIFVATKGQANETIAKNLAAQIPPGTCVISMQNGMAVDILHKHLPENQVLGCVIAFGVEQKPTGEIVLSSSEGEYIIGALNGKHDERTAMVKTLLSTALPCHISTNMRGELFSKLIISSCINPLSALTDQTLGTLMKLKRFRLLFIQLMREGMLIAEKLNIHVEPATGGKLDYYAFLKGNSWLKEQYRHLIMRIIGWKHGKVVTSSLQDIRKGKKTEIPYLNGWLCEQAEQLQVDAPLNNAIVSLMYEVEAGARKQAIALLDELPL